jgi:hypothetical protein
MSDSLFDQQLKALLDEIRDLPGNIEKNALKKAMEEAAVTVAAAVSQEAPVASGPRTTERKGVPVTILPGNLKASVTTTKPKAKKFDVSIGITGAYYARWVEFGHAIVKGRKNNKRIVGHSPPNNFIQRGFEKSKDWALDTARKVLVEEIEKRINRLRSKVPQK